MTEISITHPGSFFGRKAFRIQRSIPESWDDMSVPDIWRCVDLLITQTDRSDIVRHLLALPSFLIRAIHHGQMFDLARCIDWMAIDQASTTPLAPYITVQGTRLYLPCAQWANVVGMEYALVDDLYHEFINAAPSESQAIQDRMLAILLRPAGASDDPYSDPRCKLISTQQSETWLPLVASLSLGLKTYMTILVSANIQYLHDTYGRWLFEREEPEGEVTASSGTGDLNGGLDFGWWGAFMDIAKDGLFGDLDHVHQTPVHTLCMHLCRKVEDNRRLKAEYDAMKARRGR